MSDLRTINPRTGTSYIGVSNRHAILEGTITRLANTTQYAAGDVVSGGTASTPIEFGSAAVANGMGGRIVTATLHTSQNASTKPQLRLYLFAGSPTIASDNEPFDISDASALNLIPGGVISFGLPSTFIGMGTTAGTAGNAVAFGTTLINTSLPLNIPYQCAAASRSIWGVAVEGATYTPIASETFTFRLGVVED